MKIAIFTYHFLENYGAQLQGMAIQRFLASKGFESELVNYIPGAHRRAVFRLHASMILGRGDVKFSLARSRAKAFKKSLNQNSTVSKKLLKTIHSVKNYIEKEGFNCLICGSDELWNFGNHMGYQEPYILDLEFSRNVSKVSYAASMGSYLPEPVIEERMRSSLADFKRILVRDPQTKTFVAGLGFEAQRVLDPAFIWDFEIVKPELKPGSYVLLTGILSDSQLQYARDLAESMGLPIVAAGYHFEGVDDSYYDIGTNEWLGLIANAALVISSLFHATVFAIKYAVPFLVYQTVGKEQKLISLLELFDLSSRLVTEPYNVESMVRTGSLGLPGSVGDVVAEMVENSRHALLSAVTN